MNDPFAGRKEKASDDAARREAEEKMRVGALLETDFGRWVLGDLVGTFEGELRRKNSGHNSDDSYHRGIQDATKKYRDLIIKHFGNAGLDKLDFLKGKS